jgi:hypothetical protein
MQYTEEVQFESEIWLSHQAQWIQKQDTPADLAQTGKVLLPVLSSAIKTSLGDDFLTPSF